jgi:putative transposase
MAAWASQGATRSSPLEHSLKPTSHAEAVALFRHGVLGALTQAQLDAGQLKAALQQLSHQRLRPPGAMATRRYSVATLERWFYRYKQKGLAGLMPAPRSDKGRARALAPELRQVLLDIRREHPAASVPLILRTLQAEGRLQPGSVSAPTVRRLLAQAGLPRRARRALSHTAQRLRWQAEGPMVLWHGDVCHGKSLRIDGRVRPLRIHALMDDASRYVTALWALHSEREQDMLTLLAGAIRRLGVPKAFYLDNGSTYRGEGLATACARLGVTLLHARPYDPQARGKMERFWRTLREGCLDYLGEVTSLHEVNVRLWAWLDQHYHLSPHAALLGRSPQAVFRSAPQQPLEVDEARLRQALTGRVERLVRKDSTLSLSGQHYELEAGHLAGQRVVVCHSLLHSSELPWVEHAGRRYGLRPVDPVRNGRTRRKALPPSEPAERRTAFNPPKALLDKAVGRKPGHRGERKQGGDS